MSEVPARSASEPAAFDMKAGQFTIPTLVLRDIDIAGLDAFLAQHADDHRELVELGTA